MNQFLFTKELLESCTVAPAEKYNIGYAYEDNGIYLTVCKLEDGVATIVVQYVIPWPRKDAFDIVQKD